MGIKVLVRKICISFFKTKIGITILRAVLPAFKNECMEVLGRYYNDKSDFTSVAIPQKIKAFEDLLFLFWPSPLNRGIVRLDLDEAALVYSLLKEMPQPFCVEIGRFKGGSTFLIAAAGAGELLSIDYHVKMMLVDEGRTYDDALSTALKTAGINDRVTLAVGDSTTFPNQNLEVDFLFVDGDHSYEGVKKDYLHWIDAVKHGGHILFHDAVAPREFTTKHDEVFQFIKELEQDDRVHKIHEVGSIVHFVKR